MGLFFNKPSIAENRIENSGRWPVRLTHFHLIDEYEFPATNFPEIFFVRQGHFLHQTDGGTQAVREGAVLVVHPGQGHCVKQPEEVVLARIRYLPEWLTREWDILVNSPQVLMLFLDQSWFRAPRDEHLHVFTTRSEGAGQIRGELEYVRGLLRSERQLEPITRVSLLKLMMLLSDEHDHFWRGAAGLEIPPEARHALDCIESTILQGAPFEPDEMRRGGFEKRAIERNFENLTGMTLADYARRRRIFHAAFRLLADREEPRRISRDLGFSSTGDFHRQFESVFAIAPAAYREKFGMPVAEVVATTEGAEGA